jgi:hypothetical protein
MNSSASVTAPAGPSAASARPIRRGCPVARGRAPCHANVSSASATPTGIRFRRDPPASPKPRLAIASDADAARALGACHEWYAKQSPIIMNALPPAIAAS